VHQDPARAIISSTTNDSVVGPDALRAPEAVTACSMLQRQAPQPLPAPVQRATASTLFAPSAMARAMWRSDTDLQRQTIIEDEVEYNFQ
jgi:hypothetical protein